jgi:hypothetical protein
MLTGALARQSPSVALKADALRDLVKNALVYENLRRDKDLFDEFYKKLLWWRDFALDRNNPRDEVKRQLEAISLWLEKKILCGGEPEIVKGEVVNFDEGKNLLNLLSVSDFEMKTGEVSLKKVKLVGRAKRFIGRRRFAERGSSFEGVFKVNKSAVGDYERHAQKPAMFEVFKENRLVEVVNRFSLKVLEADKAFFADRGYATIVRKLEDIEAESGECLVRLNYHAGILPYGAELFIYETVETGKGRKEFHHLSEMANLLVSEGLASEILKETREITADRNPIGWSMWEENS